MSLRPAWSEEKASQRLLTCPASVALMSAYQSCKPMYVRWVTIPTYTIKSWAQG